MTCCILSYTRSLTLILGTWVQNTLPLTFILGASVQNTRPLTFILGTRVQIHSRRLTLVLRTHVQIHTRTLTLVLRTRVHIPIRRIIILTHFLLLDRRLIWRTYRHVYARRRRKLITLTDFNFHARRPTFYWGLKHIFLLHIICLKHVETDATNILLVIKCLAIATVDADSFLHTRWLTYLTALNLGFVLILLVVRHVAGKDARE